MLFNSYIFIFGFLPVALLVFFAWAKFGSVRAARVWMAIASVFFYGYWNIAYLPLLLISIALNYGLGQEINRARAGSRYAKILLVGGIGANLAILGYYKYASFFASSANELLQTNWQVPDIVLPLAISFYTFTQMAYLVDAYRGEIKNANYDFVTYGLFVSFFPQLIAGPILRHDELIPQFRKERNFIFSSRNFARGLTLFILGLSKKVLIADNLSPWVASAFDHASAVSFLEAWIGALSYTLQLYFDFSGYSDMAIGLGWMVNIRLPINFNSPYKATSIADFWRRWHITLSSFLRDYLYIPLGGNRRGEIRRYINLIITMLLGGLWHGAGWSFVIWGGLHGLFLAIEQAWRRLNIALPKILAWAIAFIAVVVGWVLFRATTISDAIEILQAMAGTKGILLPQTFKSFLGWLPTGGLFKGWQELTYLPDVGGRNSIVILVALMLAVTLLPNSQQIMERFKPTWWVAGLASTLALFCLLSLNRVSEFLYFQF
ncbi:MAG: MBOAT family protein [Oscillatoria sp. SIO1A7]|nr:MBOAT family protein [Oscillatoria sp. SIO1A7]